MAEERSRTMRIDKWLWSIRVFKTRSLAADACKHNKIWVGGVPVKPAREIRVGDVVEVRKMPVVYTYRVKAYLANRIGAKLLPEYVEDLTPQSELDKLTQNIMLVMHRDRGTGRPTKKDRREIESLMDEFFADDDDSEE